MARKMKIPPVSTPETPSTDVKPVTLVKSTAPPVTSEPPATTVTPATIERAISASVKTQKKIFSDIKSSVPNHNLEYANLSDEKIYDSLRSITKSNSSKFDTLINILERYGKTMQQCDEVMNQIDEQDESEFFNEVNQFVIKIESNYNALMNYFSRMPIKNKLDFLEIDEDTIKVSEIDNYIKRITQIEYFSDKQKNLLIGDLIGLIEKMNKDYAILKEQSFLGAFFSATIALCILFGITTVIAGFLGPFSLLIVIGYIYYVFKKYGQLKSVARSLGESGGIKLFLMAMAGGNKD